MRRFAHTMVAGLLFVSVAGTAANAAKTTAKKSTKAATMKCPKCGMTMSPKKTAAMPAMMKINGKTWYCCEACGKSKGGSKTEPKAQ